jgi:hypothetical protein
MRKLVVIMVGLVIAAGLAGAAAAGSRTGVWGYVTRGPVKPVCEEGVRCFVPAGNVTLVVLRQGREVTRVKTRADGRYSVTLRPGVYRIRPLRKTFGSSYLGRLVTVKRGLMSRLDLNIDTGIRRANDDNALAEGSVV